jgi:hypothetical protein
MRYEWVYCVWTMLKRKRRNLPFCRVSGQMPSWFNCLLLSVPYLLELSVDDPRGSWNKCAIEVFIMFYILSDRIFCHESACSLPAIPNVVR